MLQSLYKDSVAKQKSTGRLLEGTLRFSSQDWLLFLSPELVSQLLDLGGGSWPFHSCFPQSPLPRRSSLSPGVIAAFTTETF